MGLPGNFPHPPQREGYHRNDGMTELPLNVRGPNHSSAHQRPQAIQDALRNCCGIAAKEFLLIVNDDNGGEKVYTSPSLSPYSANIVTNSVRKDFRKAARLARRQNEAGLRQAGPYTPNGMYSEFGLETGRGARKSSMSSMSEPRYHQKSHGFPRSDESDEENSGGSRKRARLPRSHRQNSNGEVPVPSRKTSYVQVDNEIEIDKLFHVRFKDMQQSACKIMGKAFVKLVEPKKQTHHPYTKGNNNAPPWWPNTTGANQVRHKEPDHLLKPERITLLVHILKMLIEPNDRHEAQVRQLNLNVQKLEEATWETMASWFNDSDHPENAAKRDFLKEIFKVAKAQQQYKNGEIDGTTTIPIMYGDKVGAADSEDEGDGDDEEEASMPTPDSLVSPPLIQEPHQHAQHNMHQPPEVDNRIGHRIRPTLVMRSLAQPSPQLQEHNQFTDQHFFPRIDVKFPAPQSPGLRDSTNHRNLLPQDYYSPHSSLSPHTSMHNWQQQPIMTNTTTSNTNQYAGSPQASLPSLSSAYPLPPLNQQQVMPPPQLAHPYQFNEISNGLPANNRSYTPIGQQQIRTNSLPGYITQPAFDGYMQDTHGYMAHEAEREEDQHHHMPSHQ